MPFNNNYICDLKIRVFFLDANLNFVLVVRICNKFLDISNNNLKPKRTIIRNAEKYSFGLQYLARALNLSPVVFSKQM